MKLELSASVLHAAAMELCLNDRVPVRGCELIEMVKVWLPSCLMDMPMRPRFGQSLASAHAWLVDAVLPAEGEPEGLELPIRGSNGVLPARRY